jgi:uncharacterized protein
MGKLAVVTGASSGIGAAFANELAARKYDLILAARRQERLEEIARSLRQAHAVSAEVLVTDLASDAGLARLEQRVAASPDLELLVNNAGFGTSGYFYGTDAASQDQMHRLHVLATLGLTRAALPGMIARQRGAIINVSSVAGFWQAPGSVSYCATKAWMNSFTKGLALELRSIGSPVQAQALCPGFTVSEFQDKAGIKSRVLSENWWLTAEQVVLESLRGLDQNQLFVIPGWRYRLVVGFMKHFPAALIDAAALRQRRGLKQD